jgi:hypothetical protein
MNKLQIYRELKRRGISVNWVGTTKLQLQTLLNTNDQLRTLIDEPIEVKVMRPSKSFKKALKRQNKYIVKKKTNTELVSSNVTFEVYTLDNYGEKKLFYYQYPFITTREKLDSAINNYIENKEKEYEMDGKHIRVIDKSTITLPTGPTPNVLDMPLRQTGTYNVDGFIDNNTWNTTPDECVIDYVISRLYKEKLTRDTIKQYLGNTNGLDKPYYNANNLIYLAERLGCNIYITCHDKLIYRAENNRNKKMKCLCFEIRNNHIYPVNEVREIQSIIASNSNNTKKQEIKEKTYKNVVFNESEDTISFLCKIIKETNKMPRNKIKMSKNRIKEFNINNTLYVCNKYDDNMKKYCDNHNITYIGQSITKYIKPHMTNIPMSFMNHRVFKHLTTAGVKFRNHIGNPYKRQSMKDDIGLDINRSYTSCVINPLDDFMVIEFDTIDIEKTVFDNKFGMYFVKTDDMTLLHRTNWYSNKILERAQNDNIKFTCKRFIKGTRSDFSFIDIVNKLTEDFGDQAKLAVNSMIGLFARTEQRSSNLSIDTNKDMIIDICRKKMPFVFKTENLYFYGTENVHDLHNNWLPIWIQILDWSNIKLHDLIMNHGSYNNLVYRKTDMAIMRNTKVDPSNEIGHYKIETKKVHQQAYNANRNVYFIDYKHKWIEPGNILEHMATSSLLITGRAGTGKSWFIREFSKNHNTIRLAYTNKAANNINGTTLHKFFKIGSDESINMKQVYKADAIFIDEISMIPQNIWSLIIDLKNNTNIPIILVGDDRQLSPVNEKSHFNNPSIHWIVDGYKIELTEKKRYDQELWDYLENPYFLSNSEFNPNAMHICYTNNKVDEINNRMNKIHVPNPIITINDIRLDIDVPLVSVRTGNNIVKNETYKIEKITDKYIKIYSVSTEFLISTFDKYFTLGYAMTTHKMQGSTVQDLLQIHEITPNSDRRLFYTAYSRATKLSNISVCY